MIRNLWLFAAVIAVATTFSAKIAGQGLLYELEELSHIDRLPLYTANGYVEQFSSYDHTGGNDDGFNGTYSYLRLEGDDQVIAEMKGPGVINRIWTPTPSSDTIEFYFDGEEQPGLSLPFDQLFEGSRFPFLEPVCGHEVGGYYCYLPIPYSKSCKVVFKGKMLFYQLQYRSYPKKTKIKTYDEEWTDEEKEVLQEVIDLWKQYGTNFLEDIYNEVKTETIKLSLTPGESIPLIDLTKGGRIVGLEMEGLNNLNKNDNSLVLKAWWDGENIPAMDVPVKDLFGYFFGERSMRSLLAGSSGTISYLYYPMPFSRSARMEMACLEGGPDQAIRNVTVRIYHIPLAITPGEGKFYTYWNRITRPPEGEPYPIMPEYKGKGHYVGTILACQGLIPGSTNYFEGDDQATIDGKLRIHGTGSEDYFNGGWYLIPDRWDMAHGLPTHGCLGYNNFLSRTGGFRHYFADKLNFDHDFTLTIEHGPVGNRFPVDYRSVAFYYGKKPLPGEVPVSETVEYPRPPGMKFQAHLMNILAFRNGTLGSGDRVGRNRVLTLQPKSGDDPMLVKFDLEVPFDGDYQVYASWFRTDSPGQIRFMQRQVALTDWIDISGEKDSYVQNEQVGILKIRNGKGTITLHLKMAEDMHFYLHELVLEDLIR